MESRLWIEFADLVNTEMKTGFAWTFIKKKISWPSAIREKRFSFYSRI